MRKSKSKTSDRSVRPTHDGCRSLSASATKQQPRLVSRGWLRPYWTMSVSTYDSSLNRTVKRDPQYSSDLGGRGIRTLVAGQPLECLTDIVQYPLATPSRRCLRNVIVWRLMFLGAIAAKYVGIECRFGKKGTTEAVPSSVQIPENPRPSRAPHPETPATSASARDAAACATPSLRFGECARESRQKTGRLLPACAPSRLPDQSAS